LALTIGDRPVHRLTADAVLRMVDAGILDEDARVELLEGVLVDMSPKSPAHAQILSSLIRWLAPLLVDHDIRTEGPLAVPDPISLPEPDLAVVPRKRDLSRHPSTAGGPSRHVQRPGGSR